MATATPTLANPDGGDQFKTFAWTLTDADPDGMPIPASWDEFSDRSVHVYGTFGAGTVTWQGTNDPAAGNWAALSTVGGAAATFAAAGIKQILETTLFARPLLTGAVGATLTVICAARRPVR